MYAEMDEMMRELEQYRRMGEDEGTLIPDDDDDGDHDIDYDGIKGRDLLASADPDSIESQYDIHRDHRPR